MVRIVIAAHRLVCEGLEKILTESELEVAGAVVTEDELIGAVHSRQPQLLLLDPTLSRKNPIDLVRKVRHAFGKLPLVVFSGHADERIAVASIRAGAQGYLDTASHVPEFIAAIRRVAAGNLYVPPAIGESLLLDIAGASGGAPHHNLSRRESDVFQLLVQGRSATQIASLLGLSVKTVSTHKSRILSRLGVSSLSALVHYALSHNLLPAPAWMPQRRQQSLWPEA
jgi:DNA-binding NarL/FixJ family response regulator